MESTVIFLMKTMIIGEGLKKEFLNCPGYHAVLTDDYENAEMFLGGRTPKVVVIEVPDRSLYPLALCLGVASRFKKNYQNCKIMLFVNYTYLDHILPEVIEAKKEGDIDAFTTPNNRLEEVVAQIKGLG